LRLANELVAGPADTIGSRLQRFRPAVEVRVAVLRNGGRPVPGRAMGAEAALFDAAGREAA
jgi:hypothetical protein